MKDRKKPPPDPIAIPPSTQQDTICDFPTRHIDPDETVEPFTYNKNGSKVISDWGHAQIQYVDQIYRRSEKRFDKVFKEQKSEVKYNTK